MGARSDPPACAGSVGRSRWQWLVTVTLNRLRSYESRDAVTVVSTRPACVAARLNHSPSLCSDGGIVLADDLPADEFPGCNCFRSFLSKSFGKLSWLSGAEIFNKRCVGRTLSASLDRRRDGDIVWCELGAS